MLKVTMSTALIGAVASGLAVIGLAVMPASPISAGMRDSEAEQETRRATVSRDSAVVVAVDATIPSAEIDGDIAEVKAVLGSVIQRGDLIATVRPSPSLVASIAQAELDVALARQVVLESETVTEQYARRRDRANEMSLQGLISESQREDAVYDSELAAMRKASAEISKASANVRLAALRGALEKVQIRSGVTGIVTKLSIRRGQFVATGEPVGEVVPLTALCIVEEDPESKRQHPLGKVIEFRVAGVAPIFTARIVSSFLAYPEAGSQSTTVACMSSDTARSIASRGAGIGSRARLID